MSFHCSPGNKVQTHYTGAQMSNVRWLWEICLIQSVWVLMEMVCVWQVNCWQALPAVFLHESGFTQAPGCSLCVLCVGEKLPEPAAVSQVYPGVLKRKCGLRFQPRMTGWPVTTDTDRRTPIIKLLQTIFIAFLLLQGSLQWLEFVFGC